MSLSLFLSHIHEEADLAKIIKETIENEFSGFVEVFVSSDGSSIPAGTNFLKRVENELINCVGALYLISPESVKRNWINFELGAVWIRNAISIKNDNTEIPTIPICHSGITPKELPMPLLNLNAVNGNSSTELKFVFSSIQKVVRGKGVLKTDFDELADKISRFEKKYTIGEQLVSIFHMINFDKIQINDLINFMNIQSDVIVEIDIGFTEKTIIWELEKRQKELKGLFYITHESVRAYLDDGKGIIEGAKSKIQISKTFVIEYESLLKEKL
jgi:hypothetical protein